MPSLAFLFPGQGAQYSGMGQALHAQFPVARATFAEADEALGFSLSRLCFQGPDEDLQKTENTQPALLAVSVAAARVLQQEHGIRPDIVAGHSLGEYSALVIAGSLEFSSAIQLVRKRGQFMQQAVPAGVGAMAALLKLPEGLLDALLSQAAQGEVVAAANFNSPDQIVIAGHTSAVERAMDLAKAAGAKRAIRLPVSAPFHCSLMKPAQEQMRTELDAIRFADLTVPLINNWQAAEIRTATEARLGLFEQIPNSVLWTQSVRALASSGVTRFIECGPGSVLIGLVRSIEPTLKGAKFGEPTDWNKVQELLAS